MAMRDRGAPTNTKYERAQRQRRVEDLLYFVHDISARRVVELAAEGVKQWPFDQPELIAARVAEREPLDPSVFVCEECGEKRSKSQRSRHMRVMHGGGGQEQSA